MCQAGTAAAYFQASKAVSLKGDSIGNEVRAMSLTPACRYTHPPFRRYVSWCDLPSNGELAPDIPARDVPNRQ